MNLLEPSAGWMPVRQHDGTRRWISPSQLSDSQIAAFDADRPDFNGALAQFAIGLLQTSMPPRNAIAWRASYREPPNAASLQTAFAPLANAFNLDGDGPRFMQDLDLRGADGEPVGIGSLLIDSPGENALRNNSDFFVKRGRAQQMCPHCAALALFTLQLNAPSGGAGHRTGLRGGGPLTTLLVAPTSPDTPRSLWHSLWLNVQETSRLQGGDVEKTDANFTFPWLGSVSALQSEGGGVAPAQLNPLHVFWAMPRRIRLDFDATSPGLCDLCGRSSDRLLRQYVTRNYGLNYKGPWRHPLSPYYQAKDDWLALHPQPGGIGYRHWLGWVMGMQDDRRRQESAGVVANFLAGDAERRLNTELRLWTFGFDMDNAKARCWYEATLPLFSLDELNAEQRQSLRAEVGNWIFGAEMASSLLRGAVKDAWFGGEARGDFSAVDASFWSRTEATFYGLLRDRIAAERQALVWQMPAAAEHWRHVLEATAHDLFDHQFAGAGQIERQNPRRVAQAFDRLKRSLDGPKLRAALGLPQKDAVPKAANKVAKRKEERV